MVSPILINATEQVSGNPIGSGATIGNVVPGGNAGAVLFIDNAGKLAQAPTAFSWGVTNTTLGVGVNNPQAPLHVSNKVTNAALVAQFDDARIGGPYTALINLPNLATLNVANYAGLIGGQIGNLGPGLFFTSGGHTLYVTGSSTGKSGIGVDSFSGGANFNVGGNAVIGNDYVAAHVIPLNNNGLLVEGPVGINTTGPSAWLDVAGNATFNGLTVRSQNAIQFNDSGSHWVAFRAPSVVSSNTTWNWPTGDGSTGQFIKTDGSGNLSFATVSGAGGGSIGSTIGGGQGGSVLFIDGSGNLNQDNPNFYYSNTLHKLAVGLTVTSLATGRITSLVGSTGSMEGLFVSQADTTGNSNAVRVVTTGGGNSIAVYQQANTAVTDFAGAITLDNTTNTGIGVNVYSNQSSPNILGALIRAHAANINFTAPVIYARNDGIAVGTPTVRLDAYSPLVYFNETAQASPAGLYSIDGKNDYLRINGMNASGNAFAPFVVFQRLDQGGTGQGGSVGIRTGINVANSTLQVSGSFAVGVNAVSTGYSASKTDEYIAANASASPNGLTISLPASAGVAGRIVHIIKTDPTGNFVGVAPAIGDTIFRRPAKQLYAQNQVVSLIADGGTNWNPHGVIAYTPPYVGNIYDIGYVSGVGASNTAILVAVENRYPVTMGGVRLKVSSNSGNVDVGVYDGTFNRLGSSGSVSCPAIGTSTVNFSTPASVYTPGVHYLALSIDNINATFSVSGVDALLGVYSFPNSFPLPASFNLTGLTATSFPFTLAGVVTGGLTV